MLITEIEISRHQKVFLCQVDLNYFSMSLTLTLLDTNSQKMNPTTPFPILAYYNSTCTQNNFVVMTHNRGLKNIYESGMVAHT
jgi:hypothetical protein